MSLKKINPRTTVLLLFMLVVAALRLASFSDWGPLTVFTPLGAMALFGGAHFSGNIKPFAFPLLTLFISDLVLVNTIHAEFKDGLLYGGWLWPYAAFALMTIAGKLLIRKSTVKSLLIAVITATLIHWLVSDIGGCMVASASEDKLALYGARLKTAIPFELRFLAGTVVFSVLMFGSFELMKRKYPMLQAA